jgi:hypothetical protein
MGLPTVDWFKTDSQGIDLRLFISLPEEIRDHVLAVDLEPGFMPAYVGEDMFTTVHEYMISHGFWLSDMKIGECPRINQDTIKKLYQNPSLNIFQTINGDVNEACRYALPGSPYYCEVRYLRTIDWLNGHNVPDRDYFLLCIFAIIDNKPGFALDVVNAYKQKWNNGELDPLGTILEDQIKSKVWIIDKALIVKDKIKGMGLI